MQNILLHELYGNAIKTGIAIIILAIALLVMEFILAKNMDNKQQKQKLRARLFYVACFVLLFVMARIWVEGFTHLLAVLGLVSAALVITNKETIMNFVGWLIITWRGLFAEDDLIQFQHYTGYVKSFGLLYFTLAEVSEGLDGNITGRVIRIPNGLVANTPLINLSQAHHLLERKFLIVLARDTDIAFAVEFLSQATDKVIDNYYKDKKEFTIEYIKKRNKYISSRINLGAKVSILPKLDKPSGIEFTVRYYCFSQDCEKIQQLIWKHLFMSLKESNALSIAFAE